MTLQTLDRLARQMLQERGVDLERYAATRDNYALEIKQFPDSPWSESHSRVGTRPKAHEHQFTVETDQGPQPYRAKLYMESDSPDLNWPQYSFQFSHLDHNENPHGVLGTGGQHRVFSHVASLLLDALHRIGPSAISLSAQEPSRRKLYRHLVGRIQEHAPEYHGVTIGDDPEDSAFFAIVHQDHLPAFAADQAHWGERTFRLAKGKAEPVQYRQDGDPERYARHKSQAGQRTFHFESAEPTGSRAWTEEDERQHPRGEGGEWIKKEGGASKPKAPGDPDQRLLDHVRNLLDAMTERLDQGRQFLSRHAGRSLWISSADHLQLSRDGQSIEYTDPDGRWRRADLAQLDHWADKAGLEPFTGPEGILTAAQEKAHDAGSSAPESPGTDSAPETQGDRPVAPGRPEGPGGAGEVEKGGESLSGGKQPLDQMSADQLAAHINAQPNNAFAQSYEVDWGARQRGQGRRVGGMVMGAMSDAPRGVKKYLDAFGKLPKEEANEARMLDEHLHPDYLRARAAGLSHNDAMVWAYEQGGTAEPGTTHHRITTGQRPEETHHGKSSEQFGTDIDVGTKKADAGGASWRNGRNQVAVSLHKGQDVWHHGQPVRGLGKTVAAAAGYLKAYGTPEVDVAFEVMDGHESDKAVFERRIAKLAEQSGYTPGESVPRVEQGHPFEGHYVVTMTKKASSPDEEKPTPDETPTAPPGADPREAATATTKAQLSDPEEYAYARRSAIPNAGRDIVNSSRHRRNAWRGLEDAEQQGTAEQLVTRANLLKNEPLELSAHVTRNPLTTLVMHYAMQAFPPQPNNRYSSAKTPEEQAKARRQYLDAYRQLKAKAESLAATAENPLPAIKAMQSEVGAVIRELRGQGQNQDRYNVVANSLVATLQSLTRHGQTSVMGKANEFARHYRDRYGLSPTDTTSEELHERLADHVGDVLEGRSFRDSFGLEAKKRNQEFDPADLYVSHAERRGGPRVPGNTAAERVKYLEDSIGFFGVQWGNSVTDKEREHHAQKAVEAFVDLADILGLPVSDISQGGQLGLAIGARGHGTALAHYEPQLKMPDGSEVRVINLTRKSGVGSLAHEWGHFFDNMLEGYGRDKFMSEDHGFTHEIIDQNGRRYLTHGGAVPSSGAEKRERPDTAIRQAYARWAEAVQSFKTRLRGVIREAVADGSIPRSKAQYWISTREVFARTFERYVQRKLEGQGRANTYLSGVATHDLWPTDQEVEAMTPAFDAIFDAYRAMRHPGVERHTILAGNRRVRAELARYAQAAGFARALYCAAQDRGILRL